jgi:hypothetical protein
MIVSLGLSSGSRFVDVASQSVGNVVNRPRLAGVVALNLVTMMCAQNLSLHN